MKIGMLSPLYESCPPKYYGGTERVVDNLCRGLSKLGHEVVLFASNDSKTKAKLVPIIPQALRLSDPPIEQDLPYITLQIAKILKYADEFDIIHNHIDFHPFPFIDSSPCPWLTTLHGRLDFPDLKMLYQHYKHLPLASISYAQQNPLPFCNWVANVYHGIDVGKFQPKFGKGSYLAFLGRICEDKGTLEAINVSKKTGIPLKIAAKIGTQDKDYFETIIKHHIDGENIEFIGEISENEKSNFLSNAIALLTPINWPEPFGLVVIESFACGTPVIAKPFGALPEIIKDGENGFLRTSTNGLVEAVNQVDNLDRKFIRKYAEKNFSYEYMTHNYLKIYHQLINEKQEKDKI